MYRTFLARKYLLLALLLAFFFWLFSFTTLLLLLVITYSFFYLVFRRSFSSFKEDQAFKSGVIYSPVNGNVSKIEQGASHPLFGEDQTKITVVIPWWNEMGIYLPMTSEVKEMKATEGKSHFRYAKLKPEQNSEVTKSLSLSLEGVNNERVGLQFKKCVAGSWPEIGVMPGDRGKRQVNIGYFPFGGTLEIFLPNNYDLLVSNSSEILAGETLIAGLPE